VHHGAPTCTIVHQCGEITMTASKDPIPKICMFCQNLFEARKSTTQYCSHECANRAYKERKRQEKIVHATAPYETVRGLMGRGHKVGFARGIYGGYQAIYRDPETGFYHGASESRKHGQAVGY